MNLSPASSLAHPYAGRLLMLMGCLGVLLLPRVAPPLPQRVAPPATRPDLPVVTLIPTGDSQGAVRPASTSLPSEASEIAPGCHTWEGDAEGTCFAVVSVDARQRAVDLQVNGSPGAWISGSRSPRDADPSACAVLSGTFSASGADGQPLGILVYQQGRRSWTPSTVQGRFRAGRRVVTPVWQLRRWHLAILDDGQAVVEPGLGEPARRVRERLERRYHRRVHTLLGGGGPLVQDGRIVLTPGALGQCGFDEQSGLQPAQARPRSAVGVDADGRLLLLACAGGQAHGMDLPGLARLAQDCGARSAMFLDAGHCADLLVGRAQRSRPLPTSGMRQPVFLVVR